MLYIFWFLHQTTTGEILTTNRVCCISFDSYIKPQLIRRYGKRTQVVYLLIPTSNHNRYERNYWRFLLYIFWFLHQTTTWLDLYTIVFSCISFDSYIKPQRLRLCRRNRMVVYLLIPTSNHNQHGGEVLSGVLYIFWFLHQTTTFVPSSANWESCISFDSYIKPQHLEDAEYDRLCCISFDSYIKPQQVHELVAELPGCISFDSYIKPQRSANR